MDNGFPLSIPPQRIPENQKNKEWRKKTVDGIIGMSLSNIMGDGRSKGEIQANYDLVNSIFNEEDMKHVLNPYNLREDIGRSPAKMQDYNIIRSKLELLKGEEMKRPFNFRAYAENGEAINEMKAQKKQMLIEFLHVSLLKELGQEAEAIEPEEIEQYFKTKYINPREVTANQLLRYLIKKERIEKKFNKGFEHALISAKEIYYVGITGGEPIVRTCNPLNIDYDKDPDVESIEDARWVKEERYMTIGSVIDEYGEYLTKDDIRKLEEGNFNSGSNNPFMLPGIAVREKIDLQGNHRGPSISHVLVTHVVWKSFKQIGFLRYTDESGESIEDIVAGDYKLTPPQIADGYTLTTRWINEVWSGTKIGTDIYVNIGPLPNQVRSMGNMAKCKLPYVGHVYNSLNSKATSLVDLVKPIQYLYIIVWYRLELEIAKAKGKKMVFDVAQLPRTGVHGMSMDRWMYYFDNLGIAFFNSMEEGREGDQNSRSSFNQFTALDMSLSQAIGQYLNIIQKLEDMVGDIMGVSKQREGQTSSSETAHGVERSIVQSSNITEPLFWYHNSVKQAVLTQLVEAAKIAYLDSKEINYVVDEVSREFLKIDGDKFIDSDYGVFISNSSREAEIIEKLEQLAQIALQSEKVRLSDIVDMMQSTSVSKIAATLKQSEDAREQAAQQAQEAQQQAEQEMQQAELAERKEAREFEAEQRELDRRNKIEVETLKAMSFDPTKDGNNNNVPDVLEQAKLFLDQRKQAHQEEMDILKFQKDTNEAQNKLKLEAEALRIKEKDSDNKVKIAQSRPKPKSK